MVTETLPGLLEVPPTLEFNRSSGTETLFTGLLYGLTNYSIDNGGAVYQFDTRVGIPQLLAPGIHFIVGRVPLAIGRDGGLYLISAGQLLRYRVDGSGPSVEINFAETFFPDGSLIQASDGSYMGGAELSTRVESRSVELTPPRKR